MLLFPSNIKHACQFLFRLTNFKIDFTAFTYIFNANLATDSQYLIIARFEPLKSVLQSIRMIHSSKH